MALAGLLGSSSRDLHDIPTHAFFYTSASQRPPFVLVQQTQYGTQTHDPVGVRRSR